MNEQLRFWNLRAISSGLIWMQSDRAQVAFRWLVGSYFLISAVNSLLEWPATMDFFHVGHRVTWIWPLVAVLSTAVELALPIFLILGLLRLLSMWGLAVINGMAILFFGPLSGEQNIADFQVRLFVEGLLLLQLRREPGSLKFESIRKAIRLRS